MTMNAIDFVARDDSIADEVEREPKTISSSSGEDEATTTTTTPKKKKKVLVTGSSGYVGQHLLASLLRGDFGAQVGDNGDVDAADVGGDDDDENRRRYEVYCAYNSLPTFEDDLNEMAIELWRKSSRSSVIMVPISGVDFSRTNYVDVIREACGGDDIDAVVHLAALSSPGYCEKNPDEARAVNCPVDLLEFNAPVIYMSTDQVYEGTKEFYREDIDETLPVNVYGRTKLAFERVLLRGRNEEPIVTPAEMGAGNDGGERAPDVPLGTVAAPGSVILRSSLVLGPPPPLKNGCRKGAFPSFLQFIEGRLRSSTPTDYYLNEFRSVVHIKDVTKAILHFLSKALWPGESSSAPEGTRVFNLGGSTRASRYDIALEVAERLEVDHSSARAVDRPDSGGGVPSPPDISMNVDKLAKELGVSKMDGLEEIVASTFK